MKKGKILATVLLACACTFALAACDGGEKKEPSTPPVTEQPSYSVSISGAPTESVLLSQGGCTLTAAGELPENAVLDWESSDSTVASVSDDGVLTYLKGGMTVITVSVAGYDGLTARFTLTVMDDRVITATGVAFSDDLPTAVSYETGVLYLTASLLPAGAQAEEVEFLSSDTAIATVDGEGRATFVNAGEVKFTVRLKSDPEIKDEHTLEILPPTSLVNTDGGFDGEEGTISLYGATAEHIVTDVKWASATGFTVVSDESLIPDGGSGNAIRVTSQGEREWSFLFIRFASALEEGKTYEISFDAKWLGEADADGFYYSIDDETQTQTALAAQGGYSPLALADVFKENASFVFTADKDYEYFYFRLITNSMEDGSDPVFFDFTLDNIALTERAFVGTALENTDGGFDGTAGKISLYSPLDSHITADVKWGAATTLAETDDSTLIPTGGSGKAIRVTSSEAAKWGFVFIHFDFALVAGETYEITFDAKWLGASTAECFYYSIDDDKQAQTTIASPSNYQQIARANLFKENATITFTADKDYANGFYLRLIENDTADVTLDFTIDNIAIVKKEN